MHRRYQEVTNLHRTGQTWQQIIQTWTFEFWNLPMAGWPKWILRGSGLCWFRLGRPVKFNAYIYMYIQYIMTYITHI